MIGEEVMTRSNMIGQNKDKLDPNKISLVKKWAFEHMPFDKRLKSCHGENATVRLMRLAEG